MRRIVIETAKPTREPAVIERLFREKLDALADPLDPGFGYDLIRLSASRVEHHATERVLQPMRVDLLSRLRPRQHAAGAVRARVQRARLAQTLDEI